MPSEINKVVFGNQTLIDLTGDTLSSASQIQSGITAHLRTGEIVTGTNTKDADTSDGTMAASELLYGEVGYSNGNRIVGTMPNNASNNVTVSTKAGASIPAGYYDGTGKAVIDSASSTALVANNIREGVSILGVTGTMSGSEGVKATTLSATPYTTAQTIVPGDLGDYNSFTQVNIAAIAYTESSNAYGITATIGTVAP